MIGDLKQLTDVPICVGFGISSPEHAVTVVRAGANGVIIGSKIVEFIEKNLQNKNQMKEEITFFIKQVKSAIIANER